MTARGYVVRVAEWAYCPAMMHDSLLRVFKVRRSLSKALVRRAARAKPIKATPFIQARFHANSPLIRISRAQWGRGGSLNYHSTASGTRNILSDGKRRMWTLKEDRFFEIPQTHLVQADVGSAKARRRVRMLSNLSKVDLSPDNKS